MYLSTDPGMLRNEAAENQMTSNKSDYGNYDSNQEYGKRSSQKHKFPVHGFSKMVGVFCNNRIEFITFIH